MQGLKDVFSVLFKWTILEMLWRFAGRLFHRREPATYKHPIGPVDASPLTVDNTETKDQLFLVPSKICGCHFWGLDV